ncbi:hypothetical protein YC2023_051838 [Brassica napus]
MENGGSTSSSSGSSSSSLQVSMQEFKLFETQSNGNGVYRVLKIDRLDASELNLSEDSTAYTKKECYEILKRIHEGNKATGGLKLVTLCHGIIACSHNFDFFVLPIYVVSGFIKFLGPYYMLVITERREICEICGDRVHEVSKSEIISLRNPSVLSNIANSRDENKCFDLPYTILCPFFVCSKLIVEESFLFFLSVWCKESEYMGLFITPFDLSLQENKGILMAEIVRNSSE